MSFDDYQQACKVADERFETLIMALAINCNQNDDGFGLAHLRKAYPELVDEAERRWNRPGGRLSEDGPRG
jgi:hypothetical protein